MHFALGHDLGSRGTAGRSIQRECRFLFFSPPKETITRVTLSVKFREKIIRCRIVVKLKQAVRHSTKWNMESGEVQESEYLAFTRKSGQETMVAGPRNREIDEAEVSCECKRERILHHRGTSRILNSLTPFYLRNSFSISPLSFFFPFSPRIHDFPPLLVLYMLDSNESAEIHAIEIENDETRFHSRNARLFHRRARQHLSSKIKYYAFLYRGERKKIRPRLKVLGARRLNNSVNRFSRQLASARARERSSSLQAL